jgi:hypothetical protein
MPDELERLAKRYDALRSEEKAAKQHKDTFRDKILEELKGRKASAEQVPGYDISISYRESNEVDEEYLEQNLPEDVWQSVTSRRLDQQKLLQAVQEGVINLDELVPATNRHKELVKRLPHKLTKAPLPDSLSGSIQMSGVVVQLTTDVKDGVTVVTAASVAPPFQITYRHAGITEVLNVKAVKEDAPIPVPQKNEEVSDGW